MICCDLCNKEEFESSIHFEESLEVWLCLVCVDLYSDEELKEIMEG